MYTFDRMIVQAEMDYRGHKLRSAARRKPSNRFAELHHQAPVLSPEVAKRVR